VRRSKEPLGDQLGAAEELLAQHRAPTDEGMLLRAVPPSASAPGLRPEGSAGVQQSRRWGKCRDCNPLSCPCCLPPSDRQIHSFPSIYVKQVKLCKST